jgi:cysteine desulfurase family protein
MSTAPARSTHATSATDESSERQALNMIYLDNAATSFPKPESVYRALDTFARDSLANPGRAGHRMAMTSERVLQDTRHLLNQLFQGESPERFVFALNATDALNMAFKGALEDGDHVITSELEHNSISRPLRALELAGRITVSRVKPNGLGVIDPSDVRNAISAKTKLIAMTHASNVLGTIQPIAEVGKISRERGILLLVDAAQTAGIVPVSIRSMGIDLLAFPGHKSLLGPTGTGALYVGSRAKLKPWREGGTGGDSASETQPTDLPFYLEGGTPNVLGIAGLAAGIKYVNETGLEAIAKHEMDLIDRLAQRLQENSSFEVFGVGAPRVATLSFRHRDLSPVEIGGILDESFSIAIRPGLHCAPYVHKAIGTFPDGTVRASPGPFSTEADIDALADALQEIG